MPQSWLINAVLFQLAWFSAALFTEFAALSIGPLLLLHFWLIDRKLSDLKFLLLAPIGWLLDSALLYLSVFSTISVNNNWLPLWLVLLWCMFILSLSHSLLWMSKLVLLWQILIGAVAGCASYMAAINFGALQSNLSVVQQILYFATAWGVLMPVLIKLRLILVAKTDPSANSAC